MAAAVRRHEADTSIKVPVSVRDRLRALGARDNETIGQTVERAVDALEVAEFWARVEAEGADAEYLAETTAWDRASDADSAGLDAAP